MLRYFLLFCFFSVSVLKAQVNIKFELLEFRNDFERQNFESLSKGDTNYLNILIGASGRIDSNAAAQYSEQLNQIFLELDSAKLMRKSTKRIVKTVFNTVHYRILKKYEILNQFCEIFETGYYNCVSASAVYAYMFARLGVPHSIIETTNHVYVVVYYDEETWIVESTDPQQGFYEVHEDDYDLYLKGLLAQKLVTQEELDSPDRDSIVNSINPSHPINAARLCRIQYFNQALFDLDDRKTWQALQNALKAYYIYPNDDPDELHLVLATWLEEERFNHPKFKDLIDLTLQVTAKEYHSEALETLEFYCRKHLDGEINRGKLDTIFQVYKKNFAYSDSAMDYIIENETFLNAYESFSAGQVLDSYKFSKKLMDFNPNNDSYQRILAGSTAQIIDNNLWPAKGFLDSVESLNHHYPELLNFGLWRSFVADFYIYEAINAVNAKNLALAEKRLNSLDEILKGELPQIINEERVALAYSKVAHYSFRRSTAEAKAWIDRGLRYSPSSSLLLGLKDYYAKK